MPWYSNLLICVTFLFDISPHPLQNNNHNSMDGMMHFMCLYQGGLYQGAALGELWPSDWRPNFAYSVSSIFRFIHILDV